MKQEFDEQLPHFIQEVDISQWENTQPEEFLQRQYLKTEVPDYHKADKLLKYSRLGENLTYDQVAFRIMAATPFIQAIKLQSHDSVKLEQGKDIVTKMDDDFELLTTQEEYLAHRPIELPDGDFDYHITSGFLKMWKKDDSRHSDITSIFPLSCPPKAFLNYSYARDLPELITQSYSVNKPGVFWLPLDSLVATGSFRRMQDCRNLLASKTTSGNFYCFISHRWLSSLQPDPNGIQARLISWQLISYLCEAVRIAKVRGLHEPRKFNEYLSVAAGVAGTDLAEFILVNVLRYNLNEESLNRVFEETESLPFPEEGYGLRQASDDPGLLSLKEMLKGRPTLKNLASKIFIWYDYSCMPQRPFTGDDEAVFLENLKSLNILQKVGLTLILLDDADDYFGRAWCTLESIYADAETPLRWFTLSGSLRKSNKDGTTESFFLELLKDRPHLVWRAVLDTELFKTQTLFTCMRRLGLSATDQNDLPFVYRKLRELQMPVGIHIDDSEVITGVFPLPLLPAMDKAIWANDTANEFNFYAKKNIEQVKTLDWTAMLNLRHSLDAYEEHFLALTEGYVQFPKEPTEIKEQVCHVCVVCSCEGEALLISNWVCSRRLEIEKLLGLTVQSLSWVSSDIAPVGKLINGQLRVIAVNNRTWVLIGNQVRLLRCNTSNFLMNLLNSAGKQIIHIRYNEPKNNVTVYKTSKIKPDLKKCKIADPDIQVVHNGGLFRWALKNHLIT
jgi:hypothetical protein